MCSTAEYNDCITILVADESHICEIFCHLLSRVLKKTPDSSVLVGKA